MCHTLGVARRAANFARSVLIVAIATILLVACDDPPTSDGVGPAGPVGPVDVVVSPDAILGSGTSASESRDAQDFDRIVLRGEGGVVVEQGATESLTVETDSNLLQYIEVEVADGTLEIRTTSGIDIAPTDSVTYRIGVVGLTGIELAGAGSIEVEELAATDLKLVLSGAGDIRIGSVTGDSLAVELSGVGSIVVAGTVRHQEVMANGLGDYSAADLASASASIDARGSTSVTVWASDTLDITAADTAAIAFYGAPQANQQIEGLATVDSLGDK